MKERAVTDDLLVLGRMARQEEYGPSSSPRSFRLPCRNTRFAIRIDDDAYGILRHRPDAEEARLTWDGPIAAARLDKAGGLLSAPPDIKPINVLATKLPG